MDKETREALIAPLRDWLMNDEVRGLVKATFSKEKTREMLENMSDYELEQIYLEAAHKMPDFEHENKFYLRKGKENEQPALLNKEDNDWVIKHLRNTAPDDRVELDRASDIEIMDLWIGDDKKDVLIPSDLFFAETIPLKDVEIVIDERAVGGIVTRYRVAVFEDYKRPAYGIVGAIEDYTHGLIIPLYVYERRGCMGFGTYLAYEKSRPSIAITKIFLGKYTNSLLQTWYGIQIALLHPTIKEVFEHPDVRREYDPAQKNSSRSKRKTRYVRRYVLNADEIKKARNKPTNGVNRSTLIWYVIGHWRHYKDGREIFIQPYWKGPLRETRKAIEPRDREVIA